MVVVINMAGRKPIRVRQVDYETNEFIEEYDTIEDAAYDNYIDRKMLVFAVFHNQGKIDRLGLKFEYIK